MQTQQVEKYLNKDKLLTLLKSKFGSLDFKITVGPVRRALQMILTTD